MRPRLVELTEENLIQAPTWDGEPGGCGWCLYWQEPKLGRIRREEGLERKRAWLQRVRKEWGGCGKLLFVGDKAVGYAQYAPAQLLPGAAEYPAGPVSRDAVLLSCLFISDPERRHRGLGSMLLAAVLEELTSRGIKAIETFARRGSPENPSGPVEIYLKHGFHLLRDDPEFPLLRLKP